MLSRHYKNWISIEDERRCKGCKENHGKIYDMDEIPIPEPPLHEHCRCFIEAMKAIFAGNATDKGKNGADCWLMKYGTLPPYYIKDDEAKILGWKPKQGNLHVVAPRKMVTMGDYDNDDGHLPMIPGRKWYEADINYESGFRNRQRIVYSNDGLIFATYDHYRTFAEIIPGEGVK